MTDGRTGLVPSNYIKKSTPSGSTTMLVPPVPAQAPAPPAPTPPTPTPVQAPPQVASPSRIASTKRMSTEILGPLPPPPEPLPPPPALPPAPAPAPAPVLPPAPPPPVQGPERRMLVIADYQGQGRKIRLHAGEEVWSLEPSSSGFIYLSHITVDIYTYLSGVTGIVCSVAPVFAPFTYLYSGVVAISLIYRAGSSD